ncbi:hypothetical protein RvY_14322 [Ramazzottius varieornatus]|uniref:TauD/TfdA-like domain-containing protein n=1 Tax=Ramazzottius varieornatus TaxID=947166 RepID=A0A1D1VZC5_RAMVA|nr:hypothetical protein RvY_14322 [Ramazzottius varieornatus]
MDIISPAIRRSDVASACSRLLRTKRLRRFCGGTPMRSWSRATTNIPKTEANKVPEVQLFEERSLKLAWYAGWPDGGHNYSYPHQWLRFHCQCAECRQPFSNQRILDPSKIPGNITLLDAFIEGDCVVLEWTDNHKGRINLKWLVENHLHKLEKEDKSELSLKKSHSIGMSVIDYKELEKSEYVRHLYEAILKEGHIKVHGLPTTPGTVKKFVQDVFNLPVQRTIYGEVFDVMSTDKPINVAYSNAELKPHMDLVYYESPPGLQLLHCLKFDESVQGGESILIDGFDVAEKMRYKFPAEFNVLCSTPVTFEKIHYEREWPVHMRYRRPHIVINDKREITGFFWAPQFEGPFFASEGNVERYYDAYRKLASLIDASPTKKSFLMRPGDLIIFNNRTWLHGRNAFTVSEGVRHLQGCYVNIDEFQSQAQVTLFGNKQRIQFPHVGNQSF